MFVPTRGSEKKAALTLRCGVTRVSERFSLGEAVEKGLPLDSCLSLPRLPKSFPAGRKGADSGEAVGYYTAKNSDVDRGRHWLGE